MSPESYKLLCLIASLPGKYYPEDQRPAEISPDRQSYLVELGYLLPKMLVSKDSHEPHYPNGCVGYFLSPKAEDDLQLYEIEADRKAEQYAKEIDQHAATERVQHADLARAALNTALDLILNK